MSNNNNPYYTVWIGGGEYNSYYLELGDAIKLRDSLVKHGYDDVIIANAVGEIWNG
jgi:hypothetical protein